MRGSVARGTILGFVGQAWHLLATFFLYGYLARTMGPELFGDWRIVLSVLGWFEIALHSGIADVATKRMAEEPDNEPTLMRATYVGQALLAAVTFVLMVVFAGPVAGLLSNPELAGYLRIAALDVPLYGLFIAATAFLLGKQRFERNVFALAVYAAAKLVAIAALVFLGFSVTGALVGNALASVAGFAAAFVPIRGSAPWAWNEILPTAKRMSIAAVPFLTLSLVDGVGRSADLWLVSAMVTSAVVVGWYASAAVLAEIPVFLFGGLSRVLFPSVARSLSEGDHALASRYATQAMRLGIIVTVMVAGLMAGAGRQVLELLYSADFAGAYVPLAVLTVASTGRVARSIGTSMMLVRDQRVLANVILAASLVAQLALLVVLAGRYGAIGAAVAATSGALLAGGSSAYAIRDLIGVRPLFTLARCGIAAALVAVGLQQFSYAPIFVLIALPVAALAYLVLITALREVGREDYLTIKTAIGR